MSQVNDISMMPLDGGIPCLDFINSAYDTEKEVIVERLHTYFDLLILAGRISILSPERLKELREKASLHSVKAAKVLEKVKQVRQVIFRVFTSLAKGALDQLDQKDLKDLTSNLHEIQKHQVLTLSEDKLKVSWKNNSVNLEEPLWEFLQSVHDLIHHTDQHRIKKCATCEWLFLDETKNNRRKWCSMQTCGSIEKSRRYYQRKKRVEIQKVEG